VVADVEWGHPPETLQRGLAALQRGDARTAVQVLGYVQSLQPLVVADAAFHQVRAAVAAIGGDQDAAATAARHAHAWLEAHRDHFRTGAACLLAARAERLAGFHAAATSTLRRLLPADGRTTTAPALAAEAAFELGLCTLAAGDPAAARRHFQDAGQRAARSGLSALAMAASAAAGETLAAEGQTEAATTYFRELTRHDDAAARATGHAGLGALAYTAAGPAGDPALLRAAQIELARALVLDPHDDDASAKAELHQGLCLLRLDGATDGDGRRRAFACCQRVLDRHPSSRWAAAARAAMTR
jgi:tetratricopeptide (TPR) repeat protein